MTIQLINDIEDLWKENIKGPDSGILSVTINSDPVARRTPSTPAIRIQMRHSDFWNWSLVVSGAVSVQRHNCLVGTESEFVQASVFIGDTEIFCVDSVNGQQ